MRLLHRRRYPIDHYVLIDDHGTLPADELVASARRQAEALARKSTGNAQGFTLIHNGAGIARRQTPHVHILCTRTRFQKGLLYLVIGIKNLFSMPARAGT